MRKVRNSNIELIRIISILFILISHYSVHNGVPRYTISLGLNRFLLEIMTLGNIGTVLFVFISGYFLINSKKIRISKLIKLIIQIWIYSMLVYILFIGFGIETFSLKSLIKCMFPISFDEYWFATVYIILYFFHPFINKLINNLSRKEHLSFVLSGLFVFSILHFFTTSSYYGNELIQFILFYSIGAYFGKYRNTVFENNKINYVGLLLSIIIIMLSVLVFDIIGLKYTIFDRNSIYLLNRTSPFVIIFSICLFNIFVNKRETKNTIVNLISSSVFGIYLITESYYMRKWLWTDFFENSKYIQSNWLIIHMIVCVTVTFVACCIIDLIRIYTIDKIYDKYISNKIDKIQNYFEELYDKKILIKK